jgi:DNA-directed RNA polymerase sigma subunit (sigma70/sigma32)
MNEFPVYAEPEAPFGISHPLLDEFEERELGRLMRLGSRLAADRLAQHNIRLVWFLADRLAHKDMIERRFDMFSAGVEAMWTALPKWDPDHASGGRLAGYLGRVIVRAMTRQAKEDYNLPVLEGKEKVWVPMTRTLEDGTGREVPLYHADGSPIGRWEYQRAAWLDLDAPMGGEDEETWGAKVGIYDPNIDYVSMVVWEQEYAASQEWAMTILDIVFALGGLSEKEMECLMRMWELGDYPQPQTYDELAEAMGYANRSGAQKLYARAMAKARAGAEIMEVDWNERPEWTG